MSNGIRHVQQAMAPVESKHAGVWITLAVLGMLLLFALLFAYVGWTAPSDASDQQQMSASGYVAMAFGIIVTLALGVGLMTLVFYSNRKGHDQDANADRSQ